MRQRIAILAAGLLAGLALAAPALADTDPVPAAPVADPAPPAPGPVDAGDFLLDWGRFKGANHASATALRRSGAMERVLAEANARFALPRDIPILFTDDTDAGPAFIPAQTVEGEAIPAFIVFPGGFLTDEVRALRKELRGVKGLSARQAMIYANQFVLAHEVGHAVVDQLDLPITGREEDAVDGFAAYLLAFNPGFGPLPAISAALLFDALRTPDSELGVGDFADEHSLPQQRTYQFLCWVYGSDRRRFASIVGRDGLPRARARHCGDEWRQVNRSWGRLLAPYAKAPAT